MHIKIHDTNEHNRRTWKFWVSFPHVILDEYTEASRKTRRHKFIVDDIYRRIDQRHTTLQLEDVPRPAFVIAELYAAINAMVRIITREHRVVAGQSKTDKPFRSDVHARREYKTWGVVTHE